MKLRYSEAVLYALENNLPLVALESTIIAHGMPYPRNVEVALKVEQTIKDNGAVPATIGIIAGEIVVGLSQNEIDEMGQRKDVLKVSRQDLAYAVAFKKWGATTVAATMIIAKEAGIQVFATGGIGGVHRGAEDTFDISADLDELGRNNVVVVCAGPKAILDVPKTLEYLETKGVPVIGYNTDFLPLFYSRSSELRVLYNLKKPEEIARFIIAHEELGLKSGIIIANPLADEDALSYKYIENVIDESRLEMKKLGIHGKKETPYLLGKIAEITKGQSLIANEKLIISNAKLSAKIAESITRELYENKK